MKYLLCLLLSGCAHTSIYIDGRQVARFEGDMRNTDFSYASGSTRIKWKSEIVDHSSATLAQGKAASDKIQAVGAAAAAAGVMTFIK